MASSAADAAVATSQRIRDEERRSLGGGRGRRPRAGVPSAQWWRPWLLLLPAFTALGVLLLYPIVRVVLLSFQEFGLRELGQRDGTWVDRWIGVRHWTGFDNYRELVGESRLWTVVVPNTVVFAIVNVALTVAFGTLVALLLFRLGPWMRGAVSTCIMAAWALPAVTGTYVWVFIFDARRGPAIRLLDWLGLADPETTNWFSDRLSFYAIATLNVVHHGFPFVAVTVLAGLMTIPKDVIESTALDGANAWQRFWYVTAPMLKPVFAVVTILSTIWDFKVFTQIYLMPGGDGINREVYNFGTFSYVTAFSRHNFGYGSAIAVSLTVLLLLITLVYLRMLFREDEL